ncbi:winged helix-turn-helix transcriptional regulator [Bacillus sp. RG28]|uniref:Winged helix-turn-helix transcriptional regulator n=1 Tax=Gottfriedia endophytica TaxID=2820819 RepID=A0A940NJ01_9BACI|nr:winged helix-turn-helix domain-containing protein [Gottfriedia endophytica]MBP0725245.1 winged helix-turn-helix transcriptional regulator [Gottfriedia endophytica]
MENNSLKISADQQKLVANATRIKIIYLLKDKEMTAKEVATSLGKSNGSVHYHIQQLYEGGILELTKEVKNRGIIEKYYRSKATRFEIHEKGEGQRNGIKMATNLLLNESEKKQFLWEMEQLLVRWEGIAQKESTDEDKKEFSVSCEIAEESKEHLE